MYNTHMQGIAGNNLYLHVKRFVKVCLISRPTIPHKRSVKGLIYM